VTRWSITFRSLSEKGRLQKKRDRGSARARVYPHPLAAGDARPSGGQTATLSANGMRGFENNRENIIRSHRDDEFDLLSRVGDMSCDRGPGRHPNGIAGETTRQWRQDRLSASVNRSIPPVAQNTKTRISSGGIPACGRDPPVVCPLIRRAVTQPIRMIISSRSRVSNLLFSSAASTG